jgi:hypothetical protein
MPATAADLWIRSEVGTERTRATWQTTRLLHALLAGPASALAFVRRQEPAPLDLPPQDEAFVRAGALIDLTRRELRWFGGSDAMHDLPLRAEAVRAVQHAWPGWSTDWAHGGALSLADRCGVDLSDATALDPPSPLDLTPPAPTDWRACPLTVQHPNGTLVVAPLACDAPALTLLRADLRSLDEAARQLGARTWDQPTHTSLCGGLHLDLATRTAYVWQAAPLWRAEPRLTALPGPWTVRWWGHEPRAHLQLAHRALRPHDPPNPAAGLLARVRADLHADPDGLTRAALHTLRELPARAPADVLPARSLS